MLTREEIDILSEALEAAEEFIEPNPDPFPEVPRAREILSNLKSSGWISKKDRLPAKEDADKYGLVLGIGLDDRQHMVSPRAIEQYPSFTHWMPLPKRPSS